MTRVISIFERIGLGGGGKVKAVLHRMNAIAEMDGFDPVLLDLDHSPRQKLNFAALQAEGAIAARVAMLTVADACHRAAVDAGVQPHAGFPAVDQVDRKGGKVIHYNDGRTVMVDQARQTPIGVVTRRSLPDEPANRLYILVGGMLEQIIQTNADGTVETTDYARGLPIRWVKTRKRGFVIGRNLVSGTICRTERILGQSLFDLIAWEDDIVFFDGVTSAYLAPVTRARRALFLHADHRSPTGAIVPRSKFLLENFKGEAILTSTRAHKARIEANVTPAADIHVIPHFCECPEASHQARRDLVTVSRLELTGKPIHDCIDAFRLIKDTFPEVNYLIYGIGAGRARLEAQIARLGCGDRVRLMGYTMEPLAVFQRALASVYPTTTEGFGLSILEALSNGCPVISHDVDYGPREMIVPGRNGELVPPADVAALAEAMRRVLSAPERYQRATNLGLQRYTRAAYLENYRRFLSTIPPDRELS